MTTSFVIPGSCVLDNQSFLEEPITTLQLFYYHYVNLSEKASVLANIELIIQQEGFIRFSVGSEPKDQFTIYYLIAEFDNESNVLIAKLSLE